MDGQANFACQRVAHRGGSALAPENTMAAFRQAATLPVDAIELDVQMSRDGQAIVFHDETLERLTNGQGNILDCDLTYLRTLSASTHFVGGEFEPQRIPLLSEVLDFARQTELQVYIEIKSSQRGNVYGRYPGIEEAVVTAVQRAGLLERVLIMAFDWEILSLVKALVPEVPTAALVADDVWNPHTGSTLTELVAPVRARGCECINMDYKLFTPAMPDFLHRQGLRLGMWTVNTEADLHRLQAAGVDSLTTDRPDLFNARAFLDG